MRLSHFSFVLGVFVACIVIFALRSDLPGAVQFSLEKASAANGSAPSKGAWAAPLLAGCGDLCRPDDALVRVEGPYHDFLLKDVNCKGLWANTAIERSGSWPPPALSDVSVDYLKAATLNGTVPVSLSYFCVMERNKTKCGKSPPYVGGTVRYGEEWTTKGMMAMIAGIRARTFWGSYGASQTYGVYDYYLSRNITGQHFLVIGSERPWVEACLLAAGAAKVATIKPSPLHSPLLSLLITPHLCSLFSILGDDAGVCSHFH
jgi:hypothetical protein